MKRCRCASGIGRDRLGRTVHDAVGSRGRADAWPVPVAIRDWALPDGYRERSILPGGDHHLHHHPGDLAGALSYSALAVAVQLQHVPRQLSWIVRRDAWILRVEGVT